MTDSQSQGSPVSADARKWAMIAHLSALVGLLGNGVGFLLGPLIVWMMKREEFEFVNDQGKEALNFQITMMIAAVISLILSLLVVGLFLLVIVGLVATILPIVGGIKANEGEHYRYPLTYRFIK